MVVSHYTNITVDAVEGLRRHIKPTFSTESILPSSLRCPGQSPLFLLAQRISYSRVTQADYQIRQCLSDAYDISDDDDIYVLYVVVDVSDE